MNSVALAFSFSFVALLTLAVIAPGTACGAELPQLVLLNNGNVLRGVAQSQGDQIILDRGDGSQIRIPQSQIAYSAMTIEELYQYRASQRGFRSTEVHAEDARWCLRYGLIEHAEAELKSLQSLDRSHPDGLRLQRQIAAAKQPRATAPLVYPSTPTPTHVETVEPLPEHLSPASFAEFASRVQPMLINRCGNAGCHRSGGETAWQLSHLGVNVRVSSRTTHRNLTAALPYIDLGNPTGSELLLHLTQAHADGRYKPAGRASQSAETTLHEWLLQLSQRPQPNVPNPIAPIANTVVDPPPFALGMQVIAPVSGQMPPAAGFVLDAEGELIYNPEQSSDAARPSDAASTGDAAITGDITPAGGVLLPHAWPPPILRSPSPSPSSSPSSSSSSTSGPTTRPTRLPAVANPFSADLFNRRHQGVRR